MAHVKSTIWIACATCAIAAATLATSAQQPKPAPAIGVYSDAQAARGAAIYAENCAQCHAGTLEGSERGAALTGALFVMRWLAGRPLAELFDYMRTEMPLNSPGGLSPQQNADLVAFLLQKSGYPAGKADLPNTSAQLARITAAK